MTNDQNAVRGRHLDSLAADAKRYVLEEILDVTNAVAAELNDLTLADFTGAGLSTAGLSGLVPAPSIGDEDKFLRGDGTWASVLGGAYELPTASPNQKGGVKIGDGLVMNGDTLDVTISGGASYADFTGATSVSGGLSGLVPAPSAGDQMHFLRGDGVWASVGRDPCTLTLSEISGTVRKNATKTFTVTTPSDGALFVASSDTSIATAAVSGKTVTVTGVGFGTATITVSQTAGFDYAAPTDVTYSVSVEPVLGATLNDTDWPVIADIAQSGLGDTYWDIGDYKEITLNGKIGSQLTLSNQTLRVFILHFNYALNGTADNNIIWGGFKTADGTDVALCDAKYRLNVQDDTICFNMNHWSDVNYGGWKGCDLRYDVLGATSTQPSDYGKEHTTANVGYDATAATLTNPKADTLLAALPSDFRNALRLWNRWIDADADASHTEAAIEETVDAVTLLAEFEIYGTHVQANRYEQNHQTQMDYYRLGNSKSKYNHTTPSPPVDSSFAVDWWLASPYSYGATTFNTVVFSGGNGFNTSRYSYGIAPAFMT